MMSTRWSLFLNFEITKNWRRTPNPNKFYSISCSFAIFNYLKTFAEELYPKEFIEEAAKAMGS
jgi:hypothetical protein